MFGHLLGSDPHALAAPYALDALDPDERRRFEEHVDGCPVCTSQLRTLSDGVVRLAFATAAPAPAAMRPRILTAVRATPQESPAEPARVRPDDEPAAPPARRAPARGRQRLRRPLLVPVAFGAAVLALVAATLFGVQALRTGDQLDRERARAQAIASVLAAPDARASNGRDGSGRGIGVIASAAQGRAVVTVTGLGSPPAGKVHQLWLLRADATPRSLGLLDGDTPLLATGLHASATSLAVTTEPHGGSSQPTTDPLVRLTLDAAGFAAPGS